MKKLKENFEVLKRKVEKEFSIDLSDLTYDFEVDSIRVLGQFSKKDMKISLNKWLYNEKPEDYFEYVVKHEMAHAIVNEIYGYNPFIKPHGREFKRVCRVLGIPGTATTDKFSDSEYLKVKKSKSRKRKEYEYTCNCGRKHILTSIRHNRVKKGTNYICTECRSRLKFVKEL